jgi:hypothetical protein
MTAGAVTTPKDEAFLRSIPNPRLEKPFGVPDPVAGRPDARRGKPGWRAAGSVRRILTRRVGV